MDALGMQQDSCGQGR